MVAGSVMSAALPGAAEWDLVVGHRFIAALAAPAPDACTNALAEASADERATIESLVACIPVPPAGPTESFAVVWWPGGDPTDVTAVVRGDAVVDLTSPGGTRRFDARGIRPWHLAEFTDVVALRITASDAPLDRLGEAADPVPHARASLRASSIEWSCEKIPTGGAVRSIVDADTILLSRGRDLTRPIALPSRSPGAEAAPIADDAETADASPAIAPAASGVPAFRIGGGAPHPVAAPVLIGRRPLAPRIPGATGVAPELVTVDSPGAVVSGTHLELRIEGSRLVATDLRSTNGTIVRTPSGVRRMRAGESIVVPPGTSLDLGDDTIVEILLAPAAPAERAQTDSRPHP
ncbi:FHA domain-containing protein [Agromyces sp. NPDC058484]|uniref:FHA domain-containing protein n=1 Tax=Agromyces sp. NPDC058484 TaxID=3346524 RepID=UPI003662ACDD